MKKNYFYGYGYLEFIECKKYLSGNYRYVESITEDGTIDSIEDGFELFDIVQSNETGEYYYTNIRS